MPPGASSRFWWKCVWDTCRTTTFTTQDVHLFNRLSPSVYLMMPIDSYQKIDLCLSNYHITIKFYHRHSIVKKCGGKIYQVHRSLRRECRKLIFCHNIGTYKVSVCTNFQLSISIGSEHNRSNDFDSYR